ncbi:MAG: DNA primase [Agarilytica sp.]
MSRIPQSFIDDLLARLDIVSVVDSRVKLKKAGKNYSACCPFHQEKTPSFTVSPDKQFYYCFGCGASGNALGFVMEFDRDGFVEAVESLAKTAGVEVPREKNVGQDKQDFKRKKLYETLEKASDFYQERLRNHPQKHLPVRYLQNRGLSGHIAKAFGLGFAPPGYDNLLVGLGSNEEQVGLLVDAGLVIHKEEARKTYDRFRHRITFPIRDTRGRVIGFGGRVLGDDKPKYLNSPETDVFHKGRELYGLFEANKQRDLSSLLVVEGYMDVIALAQYGIYNAVATLGTACGEEHLKLAFRYVSEVCFCFDGDNAGRTAAKRALQNSLSAMEDGRQIKFLFLPEGQDPDSLVRQIGNDRFIAQTKRAVPLEEFLFDVCADGIDINTMDGRARFSKIAAPLIAQLPSGIFKELMFDNLAKRTGLSREVLNELQQEKIELVAASQAKPSPEQRSAEKQEPLNASAEHEPLTNDAPQYQAPQHVPDAPLPEYRDTPPASVREKTPERKSNVALTPAKLATILILEDPALLSKLEHTPELEQIADPDIQCLHEIMRYLKQRPNSNFNNILGYWGGTKGIEAQKSLANLMANQVLSSVKAVKTYNPLQELTEALQNIEEKQELNTKQAEIAQLKARGLANLSETERQRLIELTAS